MNNLGYSLT